MIIVLDKRYLMGRNLINLLADYNVRISRISIISSGVTYVALVFTSNVKVTGPEEKYRLVLLKGN